MEEDAAEYADLHLLVANLWMDLGMAARAQPHLQVSHGWIRSGCFTCLGRTCTQTMHSLFRRNNCDDHRSGAAACNDVYLILYTSCCPQTWSNLWVGVHVDYRTSNYPSSSVFTFWLSICGAHGVMVGQLPGLCRKLGTCKCPSWQHWLFLIELNPGSCRHRGDTQHLANIEFFHNCKATILPGNKEPLMESRAE